MARCQRGCSGGRPQCRELPRWLSRGDSRTSAGHRGQGQPGPARPGTLRGTRAQPSAPLASAGKGAATDAGARAADCARGLQPEGAVAVAPHPQHPEPCAGTDSNPWRSAAGASPGPRGRRAPSGRGCGAGRGSRGMGVPGGAAPGVGRPGYGGASGAGGLPATLAGRGAAGQGPDQHRGQLRARPPLPPSGPGPATRPRNPTPTPAPHSGTGPAAHPRSPNPTPAPQLIPGPAPRP